MDINGLPINLQKKVEKYETYLELASDFLSNNAIFHKKCSNMYNKLKYDRKFKPDIKKQKFSENSNITRGSISVANFTGKCFFCDIDDSIDNLHCVQTLSLDKNIKKFAEKLSDTKLLAQLLQKPNTIKIV